MGMMPAVEAGVEVNSMRHSIRFQGVKPWLESLAANMVAALVGKG